MLALVALGRAGGTGPSSVAAAKVSGFETFRGAFLGAFPEASSFEVEAELALFVAFHPLPFG